MLMVVDQTIECQAFESVSVQNSCGTEMWCDFGALLTNDCKRWGYEFMWNGDQANPQHSWNTAGGAVLLFTFVMIIDSNDSAEDSIWNNVKFA